MKAFRKLKMVLFFVIIGVVLVSVRSGSQVAWLIFPAAVSIALLLLYLNARKQLRDPQFNVAVAGRSLLAIGNMALSMGLVLMGALAFKEIGQLTDLSTAAWQSIGFIAAPLLEGAFTAALASFLWDDLHSFAALYYPATTTAASGSPGIQASRGGIAVDVSELQKQITAFATTVKNVVSEANKVQSQLTTLTGIVKNYQEALGEQSRANQKQSQDFGALIAAIRKMVANFQAFLKPLN